MLPVVALASCSLVADGGGRWLLMTVRGHLGDTPVMRRPSPARPWSLCVAPVPSGSFTPAWRSRLTIAGQGSPLPRPAEDDPPGPPSLGTLAACIAPLSVVWRGTTGVA